MPRPLPRQIEDSPHYRRIASSVEAARAGTVESAEFAEFLQAELALGRQRAQSVFSSARERHLNPKETALGLEGLDLLAAGLELMHPWCEDRDPAHLDAGLERVREGFERLLQAILMHPPPDDDRPPGAAMGLMA